jgi:hypothetical protein
MLAEIALGYTASINLPFITPCCRKHAQLFTIVVKNHETGYGIPVAFLLTKSTEQSVFKAWFDGLKAQLWNDFRISYAPNYVVTDQGNIEILAIHTAFPMARLHFCAWHVLRAWERKLTNVILGINATSTTVEQCKIIRELVRL